MFFIKRRFGRFMLLLLTSAVLLGAILLLGITGLDDKIFPNLKNYEGFELWMPLLPPIAVCFTGQILGDVLNRKSINDVVIIIYAKRIIFLAVTVASMFWYAYSFETNYSVKISVLESSFLTLGFIGPLFIYATYVIAYLMWARKIFYPFYLIGACTAGMIVNFLLATFWSDGILWVFLAIVAFVIIIFFAKPDERLFEEYSHAPLDPKKVIADLAYLDDPHLRPGLARDYDENGHYFGACCGNCAYLRKIRTKNGLTEYYCALTQQGCQEHNSCDRYKRAK
jgi:hypothetical protein